MDISCLESRYRDSCRRREVQPNTAVLSWLWQAKILESCHGECSIVVLLHQLKDDDIPPLIDLFQAINYSDIDAVDILYGTRGNLNAEYIMPLLRAINLKLRIVDLQDTSLEDEFLWNLCQYGLGCHTLNLRSTHIQKLNMVGSFARLHTLNLDFCTSITSLHKDCFSCMPNLMHLSMCETRIANLWTTTAALSKLPSLMELRFQNCLCCKHTGPCQALFGEKAYVACGRLGSVEMDICSTLTKALSVDRTNLDSTADGHLSFSHLSGTTEICDRVTDMSAKGEIQISSCLQRIRLSEISSDALPNLSGQVQMRRDIKDKDDFLASSHTRDEKTGNGLLKKYISNHPSPICFEKHYREYMVSSLPRLEVLDNLPITKSDREMARTVFSKYYENFPYKRSHKENVASILQTREMGTSGIHHPNFLKPKHPYCYGKSQHFFQRSLGASRFSAAAWPVLHPLYNYGHIHRGGGKRLRARQFEYHPTDSSLMALGTLDAEVVVINHENGGIAGYVPSIGAMDSVLGLCWLKKHPSKLLAGSDNGCLKLFDINHMPPKVADISCSTGVVTFDEFHQLTSVHVNSTDNLFLASGYSKNVALYDISSGTRVQIFTNMHREPINVAKFAHHSPFIFATSSFDHDVKLWDLRQKPNRPCYTASSLRGNVMVCFSPDDLYLLVSAVDNEVKQLLAADGRLCLDFEIASTGSVHNYTRSYYMNGRDYIISGSSDEHVVHICCAQTGRRLRDVFMEDIESGDPVFVQSLRGDPSRMFHMSVLTASKRPSSKWEIVKVNLLASSSNHGKEYYYDQNISPLSSVGG